MTVAEARRQLKRIHRDLFITTGPRGGVFGVTQGNVTVSATLDSRFNRNLTGRPWLQGIGINRSDALLDLIQKAQQWRDTK